MRGRGSSARGYRRSTWRGLRFSTTFAGKKGPKTLTIYLNDLFRSKPPLRTRGYRNGQLQRLPDGQGGEFIIPHLNLALEHRGSEWGEAEGPEPSPLRSVRES